MGLIRSNCLASFSIVDLSSSEASAPSWSGAMKSRSCDREGRERERGTEMMIVNTVMIKEDGERKRAKGGRKYNGASVAEML